MEYKPFELALYHTDIADWGMALEFARRAGPQAKVLVDIGHHYQATNIKQVVAWLLHLDALGGLPSNPLTELRRCGYIKRVTAERSARTSAAVATYA